MNNFDASNDWIYKVREDIYQKTKNMSYEEFKSYFKKSAEELAKIYGFKIINSIDSPNDKKPQ
jgi:hypothetical protein